MQPHFFGKSIAVQPVDKPLAPTRDDCCLRVVHMRIHEACGDQFVTIVCHNRVGVVCTQCIPIGDICDLAIL